MDKEGNARKKLVNLINAPPNLATGRMNNIDIRHRHASLSFSQYILSSWMMSIRNTKIFMNNF